MSTTSKLSYLENTKNLFKNRLNSLGAEITNVTAFRNYLNWLDTFYGDASDKTDLSVNGIVGRTSQDSTSISGGDEYDSPSPNHPQPINNLSGNVPYKITTQNGEQTFNIPLGDIKLCEIDAYKDKIYSSKGRFYLKKYIGKWVIDDTYSYTVSGGSIPSHLIAFKATKTGLDDFVGYKNGYANTFNVVGLNQWKKEENQVALTSKSIYFCVLKSDYPTTAAFKTYITNNNAIVYTYYETPTTTEITSSIYPELYAVLKEIQDYLISYKINKEFLLEYSSPIIEY